MVKARKPLRHAVVIGIFCLHGEFQVELAKLPENRSLAIDETAICRKLG